MLNVKYLILGAGPCGIYGIGHRGSREHMNMDAVIEQALELADELEIKE